MRDAVERPRVRVGPSTRVDGMSAAMPMPAPVARDHALDACFLGPYGENDTLLEKLMVEFLRDHVYWRRNFHPEDPPAIATAAAQHPDYLAFEARMRRELHQLSAALKKSVPFHSPRYIGHMASDLLLPGRIVVKAVARAINLTTSASLRHAGLHARQAQHDLGASGGGSSQRDFAVMQRGERPRDRDAKTAARADAARRPMKTLTQARQLFWGRHR